MENIGRLKLPPGFRFSPTDEELVLHFLLPKVTNTSLSTSQYPPIIIPDLVDLQLDPWDLNGKALSSGNHYFYFGRLMPSGTSRNGYWKDLEMEEPIFATGSGCVRLGTKKFLLFCSYGSEEQGAAQEPSWVMEEYQLCPPDDDSSKKLGNQRFEYDYSWVLCRVHAQKNCSTEQTYWSGTGGDDIGSDISSLDEMFLSLDDYPDDI